MVFKQTEKEISERQTVLICIPSLLIGGTEIQTLYLVRALRAWGLSVVVACYYEWNKEMVARYRKMGAEVALFSDNRGMRRFSRRPTGLLQIAFLWFKLLRMNRNYRFCAVHVQYMTPGALPLILLRLMGTKNLFATVHQCAGGQTLRAKWLLRMAASCCTRFTAVSQQVAQSWFPAGMPHNLSVIPNTIDIEQYNWLKKDLDIPRMKQELGIPDKTVIGVVARLSFVKGVDLLIDAFATLAAFDCDLVLVVVGSGKEYGALCLQAERLQISDRLFFLGEKSPEEAFRIMQLFDIVVSPSRQEGFGLSVLEAQASGKPVVAFETGGLAGLIRSELNGLLVPSGHVSELTRACMRLLASPALRAKLALHAPENVVKYAFKQYGAAVRELYYNALQPTSTPHRFFLFHKNGGLHG